MFGRDAQNLCLDYAIESTLYIVHTITTNNYRKNNNIHYMMCL